MAKRESVQIPPRANLFKKDTVVADGRREFDSVQSAVDAATGVVHVGPGTYGPVTVPVDKTGLSIIGVGDSSVIDGSLEGSTDRGIMNHADGLTLESLKVRADTETAVDSDITDQPDDMELYDVTLETDTTTGLNGLRTYGDNALIDGCRVPAAGSHGLRLRGNNNRVLNSSFLFEIQRTGVYTDGDDCQIADNMFRFVGDNYSSISLDTDCADTVTSGNRIISPSNNGVLDAGTRNVHVGNLVTDPGGVAIDTSGATDATVIDTEPNGDETVATGSVTLAAGEATVDTGVATTETATFQIALGPATDDADIAASIRADSVSGNYEVQLDEVETSVGTPTVEYDVRRVR